jgi:hypothetical protein
MFTYIYLRVSIEEVRCLLPFRPLNMRGELRVESGRGTYHITQRIRRWTVCHTIFHLFQYKMLTDAISSDELVGLATAGQTSFSNVTYMTTNETITGLLPIGTAGVNHGELSTLRPSYMFILLASGIALDGNVALLTITIV